MLDGWQIKPLPSLQTFSVAFSSKWDEVREKLQVKSQYRVLRNNSLFSPPNKVIIIYLRQRETGWLPPVARARVHQDTVRKHTQGINALGRLMPCVRMVAL